MKISLRTPGQLLPLLQLSPVDDFALGLSAKLKKLQRQILTTKYYPLVVSHEYRG